MRVPTLLSLLTLIAITPASVRAQAPALPTVTAKTVQVTVRQWQLAPETTDQPSPLGCSRC